MGLDNIVKEDKTETLITWCRYKNFHMVTVLLSRFDTKQDTINVVDNEELWIIAAQENSGRILRSLIDFYEATQINIFDPTTQYYQHYNAKRKLSGMIEAGWAGNCVISAEVLELMENYITIPTKQNPEPDNTDSQSVGSEDQLEAEDKLLGENVVKIDEPHYTAEELRKNLQFFQDPNTGLNKIESWWSGVQANEFTDQSDATSPLGEYPNSLEF